MAIQAKMYSENFGYSMDGCGFNEFWQQQQHMQQFQNQQQRNQNMCFSNNFLTSNNVTPMPYSQEIDQYVRLQNERLRIELQEQRNQQLTILFKKIESRIQILLRQKDQEIAKASNRTMELEIFLRKLEMENQAWQKIAQENEATVMSLNNMLEQLKDRACCGAEDAESCCDEAEQETGESRGIGEEAETEQKRMECKGCNSRSSCVLFLPCRHLCCCKDCEAFLVSCPVCQSVKKCSIEVLIS